MGEGYIIELDKLAGDPLDLYVNSRLIAKGEAVMVGDGVLQAADGETITAEYMDDSPGATVMMDAVAEAG